MTFDGRAAPFGGGQNWRPYNHGQPGMRMPFHPENIRQATELVWHSLEMIYNLVQQNFKELRTAQTEIRQVVGDFQRRGMRIENQLSTLGKQYTEIARLLTEGNAQRTARNAIDPKTFAEYGSHYGYKAVSLVCKAAASPLSAAYNFVTLDISGGMQQTLVAGGTYFGLAKGLDSLDVPFAGDAIRYVRGKLFGAGVTVTKESVKLTINEGIPIAFEAGKEWASEQYNSFKDSAKQQANGFAGKIPVFGSIFNQKPTQQAPLTPAQRAAYGLGADPTVNAGQFTASGGTTTPNLGPNAPKSESDLFSLLTLAAGVGLLYIAASRVTAYWNARKEDEITKTESR